MPKIRIGDKRTRRQFLVPGYYRTGPDEFFQLEDKKWVTVEERFLYRTPLLKDDPAYKNGDPQWTITGYLWETMADEENPRESNPETEGADVIPLSPPSWWQRFLMWVGLMRPDPIPRAQLRE